MRVLINVWWEPVTFALGGGDWWTLELDTADATPGRLASGAIELTGRLLVVLRATWTRRIEAVAHSNDGAPRSGPE